MPTTRPRHLITQSDDIAHALVDAARRWPQDAGSPSRLLVHLIHEGHSALRREAQLRADGWAEVVHDTSGVLTGVYFPGYLDKLREDWDE